MRPRASAMSGAGPRRLTRRHDREQHGRRSTAGGVLGAATVAMGLIAGVFYIFACDVMPSLARSDDRVFIEVMQNINDVIQNPVFFLSFMGALVLTAVSAWQSRKSPPVVGVRRPRRVRAGLPVHGRREHPAQQPPGGRRKPATIADPAAVRRRFEDTWVAWNVVRALLSTLALACLTRALLLYRHRTYTSAYLESAAGSSASR